MSDDFTIVVVPDEGCPRCGVNGSPKVTDSENRCWWKCLGANCAVGYWLPETGEIEERATPEEAAASRERAKAEVDAMMVGKHWVSEQVAPGITSFKLAPDDQ